MILEATIDKPSIENNKEVPILVEDSFSKMVENYFLRIGKELPLSQLLTVLQEAMGDRLDNYFPLAGINRRSKTEEFVSFLKGHKFDDFIKEVKNNSNLNPFTLCEEKDNVSEELKDSGYVYKLNKDFFMWSYAIICSPKREYGKFLGTFNRNSMDALYHRMAHKVFKKNFCDAFTYVLYDTLMTFRIASMRLERWGRTPDGNSEPIFASHYVTNGLIKYIMDSGCVYYSDFCGKKKELIIKKDENGEYVNKTNEEAFYPGITADTYNHNDRASTNPMSVNEIRLFLYVCEPQHYQCATISVFNICCQFYEENLLFNIYGKDARELCMPTVNYNTSNKANAYLYVANAYLYVGVVLLILVLAYIYIWQDSEPSKDSA